MLVAPIGIVQTRPVQRIFGALCVLGFTLLIASKALSAEAPGMALDRLIAAYPDVLERHDATQLYWRDGTSMPVSDGISGKSFEQLLKNASILDQLSLPYPIGQLPRPPATNDDPGR